MKSASAAQRWETSERGAVAVVVAIFAVVAMILLAFVIDRGLAYAQRAQLQNSVDAAALAAVQATCASPEMSEADIRQVAIDYAWDNGEIVPTEVIVQDDPAYSVTGVSVAAQKSLQTFFGGFAGFEGGTVAARASATRICSADFQFVASTWFEMGPDVVVDANLYAGRCFDAGPGGTYSAIIAVSESEGFDCHDEVSTNLGNDPLMFGNDSKDDAVAMSECPNPNGGSSCFEPGFDGQYDFTVDGEVLTAEMAWASSSWPDKNITTGGPLCTATFPSPTTGRYTCSGSGELQIKNGDTVGGSVVAEGKIKFIDGVTWGSGPILIYSASTSTPAIILPNYVPPNVLVYAPNGGVKFAGSGDQMQGVIFADYIETTGSGGSAAATQTVRVAGPWRLSQ